MQQSTSDTVIACLTPAGAGAIATLAVRGPKAWSITRSLFRTQLPEMPITGKFYLGRLGADADACDEIVVAVKPEGIELHCHGGLEIVHFLQELFVTRGAISCHWQDLPHDLSPLQALARNQLAHVPTVKTAAILLDQYHGAFERALAEIQASCQAHDQEAAARGVARLHRTRTLGRHLVRPARVVIAGAPNVGKSSLVNALAGFTRSVVSPIPGTTRDVVTTRIALDGWPVELIDTAGLHAGGEAIEREGMARARAVFDDVDLRLWTVDTSMLPVWPTAEMDWQGIIVNKVDLPAAWDLKYVESMHAPLSLKFGAEGKCMRVSCKTSDGLSDLAQWIVSLLRLNEPLGPAEGVAFTPELADRIVMAHDAAHNGDWRRVQIIIKETLDSPLSAVHAAG
jgi:tRNA modification GTPase